MSAGIGSGKGLRFAIADTSGVIIHKSAVNTTCGASILCEAPLSSAITLAAGVYYLGVTTDSTTFATAQINIMSQETLFCALVHSGSLPLLAGTGATGNGSSNTVDFGASMGSITSYTCSTAGNSLANKFHDIYLF
jgi:hypothetical protein